MAIAAQLDFKGATLAQYDQVIQKMGLHPGGPTPPGALFHWVAQTADGIRVVDVWQSREQFEAFAQQQIGPITKEVGIPSEPELQFFEVHNYLKGG